MAFIPRGTPPMTAELDATSPSSPLDNEAPGEEEEGPSAGAAASTTEDEEWEGSSLLPKRAMWVARTPTSAASPSCPAFFFLPWQDVGTGVIDSSVGRATPGIPRPSVPVVVVFSSSCEFVSAASGRDQLERNNGRVLVR